MDRHVYLWNSESMDSMASMAPMASMASMDSIDSIDSIDSLDYKESNGSIDPWIYGWMDLWKDGLIDL
jgi:hypothetical protein